MRILTVEVCFVFDVLFSVTGYDSMSLFDGKPLLEPHEAEYLDRLVQLGSIANGVPSSHVILCTVILKLVDRVRLLEEYIEGELE